MFKICMVGEPRGTDMDHSIYTLVCSHIKMKAKVFLQEEIRVQEYETLAFYKYKI